MSVLSRKEKNELCKMGRELGVHHFQLAIKELNRKIEPDLKNIALIQAALSYSACAISYFYASSTATFLKSIALFIEALEKEASQYYELSQKDLDKLKNDTIKNAKKENL